MDGQDDQQKSNIFSADGTDAGMQPAASVNQQGAPQKTSTEGELGDAGTSQVAGQPPAAQADQSNDRDAARQAIQRNAGKTQNPGIFNKAQETLGAADKGLQDEANTYVQGAKDTHYGVSDADINSYVSGDQDAAAKVTKLNTTGAVAADPFHTKQDMSFGDVDQLGTDAGLVNAFRNEGGADYSAGMGAFDLASARRTPGFDQLRASLAQQAGDLRKRADEYGTSKTAEAQKALEANLAADKLAMRTGLEKRSTDLTALDQAAADKANLAAHQGDKNYLNTASTKAKEDLAAKNDPRLNVQLLTSGIDPAKFFAMKDAVAKDMVTPEQAAQFNRIMAALGKSDPASVYTAGSGAPKMDDMFDAKSYRDAVYNDAQKRRGAADAGLNSQLDALKSGFQKQYDPAAEKAAEMAAVENDMRAQYGDFYDQADKSNLGTFDNGAQWDQMLSAADVAKMSNIYKQLGHPELAPQAGQYAGTGAFDKDAYRQALKDALDLQRAKIASVNQANSAISSADPNVPIRESTDYLVRGQAGNDIYNKIASWGA